VLKQLRNGDGMALVAPGGRPAVARALTDTLVDDSSCDLRLEAALALGGFIDMDGVLSTLGAVALMHDESVDLRYAAFTSLERAGPTAECVNVLRQMSSDETLGDSARAVLAAWHIK
jgi:hypothetical protein